VSTLTEDAVAAGWIDEIVPVAGADALDLARALARQEGIFAGTSSGATLAAALAVARRSPPGTNIVCMLPDTGERYLSTPLFADIEEVMNDEELALSRSTPTCRFDAPAPAAVPAPVATAPAPVPLDSEARRFVEDTLAAEPVVMFALEWCEFCWSVRKLFNATGIAYRSVDLDSVEFQQGDLGGRIRAVLAARTGATTIPRVFIGGEHVGGCTELFDAWKSGDAQRLLAGCSVDWRADVTIDPYTLLPGWLQPREVDAGAHRAARRTA
jgi:cysteine synthase A